MIDTSGVRVHQHGACIAGNRTADLQVAGGDKKGSKKGSRSTTQGTREARVVFASEFGASHQLFWLML
jgi:hypothetical protein